MTTMRRMLQRGVVLLAVVALLAAACGDDTTTNGEAADESAPSTTIEEAAPPAPVTQEGREAPVLDLTEAVSAAADGATVQLEETTYSLDAELTLEHSITILGAEGGTTIVVDFEGDALVSDRVAIRSRADEVRLERFELNTAPGMANDEATLLEIERGEFEVVDLSVQGGRVGLRISPDAAGTVRASKFESSSFGVVVAADTVVIEGNEMLGHQVGIVFDRMSEATARDNLITGCINGMLVQSDAAPLIVDNELRENVGAGIAFYEGGGGTATGNSLVDNRWGIDVRSAPPTHLADNDLESNEVAIYYWVRGGTGDVRDNRCVGNERDIVLAGPTSPDVGDNLCETVVEP